LKIFDCVARPANGVVAHRGASGYRPENTLASFVWAQKQGLTWVEFDVRLTKCGTLVVIHDATVDRTTDGTGDVSSLSLAEVKALDAGSWFSNAYEHERIPTLKEAVDCCRANKLYLNIELKPNDNPDFINKFVKFMQFEYPRQMAPPLISSFDFEIIFQLKKKLPRSFFALLEDVPTSDVAKKFYEYDFATLHLNADNTSYDMVKELSEQDIPIFLYTVNDSEVSQKFLMAGATAIFSDYPLKQTASKLECNGGT